jgi:DNA polymerase bacteriophage-type
LDLTRHFCFTDFETASLVNVDDVGAYNYARHPSTRPLMLSWAIDDEPVQLWEPHKGPMPERLRAAILNPAVVKVAFNAPFEHAIFEFCLNMPTSYKDWIDVAVLARYFSIAGGLEKVGKILELDDEKSKVSVLAQVISKRTGRLLKRTMKEGKVLIHFFCEPANMGGQVTLFGVTEPFFHNWDTHPDRWERFCHYCMLDTEAERAIFDLFIQYLYPETEQEYWVLGEKINDAGVPTFRQRVINALDIAQTSQTRMVESLQKMTGLDNPNSRDQLLPWLRAHGYPHKSIRKDWVAKALNDPTVPLECKKALVYRQEASKTSFKKFEAILKRLGPDDRLRGMFLFMGAARTARWSGLGVQFHNLPRPTKIVEKNLDAALALIDAHNETGLIEKFVPKNKYIDEIVPSAVGVVTSCIRSCFGAAPGTKLVVCDLSAIENRVLGWVSGCEAILNVFRQGLDPYVSFGVKMFKQPYEILIRDKEKRQTAKPAVLGAGYGLGDGTEVICVKCGTKSPSWMWRCPECNKKPLTGERVARTHTDKQGNTVKDGLIAYAENMGITLTPEESFLAVRAFRESYPEVVTFWTNVEDAMREAIITGGPIQVGYVEFSLITIGDVPVARIKLPSGRYLHYWNARLVSTRSDGSESKKMSIVYDGIGHGRGATTEKVIWSKTYTYGGKVCENIVQAISRDILANGLKLADEAGMEVVLHVHDEIGALVPDDSWLGLDTLQWAMTVVPAWAPGLPLGAEGYVGEVYRKG